MQIATNGISIECRQYGPTNGVPLVLIRGLGTPMVYWPSKLIDGFTARGYHIIAFDNRDIGLSQRCPKPGIASDADAIKAQVEKGTVSEPAYHLDDMALDVIGLLDALDIERAHVFGISMGGGIAQILAIHHAHRLLSATMVMTSSHFRSLTRLDDLLAYPQTRIEFQQSWVQANHQWGGPQDRDDDDGLRTQAAMAWDQGYDPQAVNRQCLAIACSTSRESGLKTVELPCHVIHGTNDGLLPLEDGQAVAELIPNARFTPIEGMGHAISGKLAPVIVEHVDRFIAERTTG